MARWKRTLGYLLVLASLLASAVLWMSAGIQSPTTTRETFPLPDRLAPVPERLTIMTWNIAWGYGSGSEGSGYQPVGREVLLANLATIAAVIRDAGADIVLLQEVDFDSRRSGHIDQAAWLAQHSGLEHIARAISWRANWVPFPYWPPAHHFGAMRSGGAVLSRLPIVRNAVELQPHPATNPWWYNLFYLFRYTQTVDLATSGDPLTVINVHFDAWDREARLAHARRLAAQVRAGTDRVVAFGGDLNTVPPEAKRKTGFAGYPEDDYRNDTTLQELRRIAGYREVAEAVGAEPDAPGWRTFPSEAPDRRLDYLFVRNDWVVESARVLTGVTVSDHLPVLARLVRASAAIAPDQPDAP